MHGPLQNLRVLDFSAIMSGPYAARWLADLGAEVIKVEPLDGDMMRSTQPLRDGRSSYFGSLNAGKKSISVDLKDPGIQKAVIALAERCDVLIENFRPGVMERLGLDYATLRSRNPKLVYCSISGYGQTGEAALLPAYAQVVQAGSGFDLAHASYQTPPSRTPSTAGMFPADVLAAAFAVMGIQAALLSRHTTGVGQRVDLSLLESILSLMPYEVQTAQFPSAPDRPLHRPVSTRDGHIVMVINTDRNFSALCECLNRPDLRSDPRFATAGTRAANWSALYEIIETWAAELDLDDCEARLRDSGVPCARYRTVSQAIQDPSVLSRGRIGRVCDPSGAFSVTKLPFLLSNLDIDVGATVPELGEHTREVLTHIAGLEPSAVDTLLGLGKARDRTQS